MKYFICAALSILAHCSPVLAEQLEVEFTGLPNGKGQIAYLVFSDPGAFPDQPSGAIKSGFIPVTTLKGSVQLTLDLKPGDYAITAFFDENKNQKLDKNFLGIPKEKFGFSNNPTITIGAPNFSECKLSVNKGMKKSIKIKLISIID